MVNGLSVRLLAWKVVAKFFFENFLMRMIGRERMALAGPKALNFCTEQLRAGRGDAPKVTVSDRHFERCVCPHRATSALWALRPHCGVSHGDGLRPTDECAAATPRRGYQWRNVLSVK
jgi:hypothetical protein